MAMKETLKNRATGNQAVFLINSAEDPMLEKGAHSNRAKNARRLDPQERCLSNGR